MRNVTNAINTMLHVHQADSAALKSSESSPVWLVQEEAVSAIEQCVQSFGHEAMQELEGYVEFLQEEFLAHVHSLLEERNIHMDEKLMLSLSVDNMLLLQCQEQEEALLSALGEDTEVRERLEQLRSTAFLARGLQYMMAAKAQTPPAHMAEYNVCVKGKLSHFYLK